MSKTGIYRPTSFAFCNNHDQAFTQEIILTWPSGTVAVPCAGCRSLYGMGSIHGWSRSHLTVMPGGCLLEECKLISQSISITVEFSVQYDLKITPVTIWI